MSLEIERRFLARASEALLERCPATEMLQGYLTTVDPVTLRIRREGDRWILAIKIDASAVSRHEIELDVGEARGTELLDLAAGGTVAKTRYRAGRWEIDVYRDRFEGLVIAEIELEAEDEAPPDPPDGLELLREMTRVRGFSSRALARMSTAEATALVARLAGG